MEYISDVGLCLPLSDWWDSGKLWSIDNWRLSSSRSNSLLDILEVGGCADTSAGRNSLFDPSKSPYVAEETPNGVSILVFKGTCWKIEKTCSDVDSEKLDY